jgi:radical SAM protein with 4Fe4S-binding SPASM domain
MNLNYADLGRIARLAAALDADFRVNAYQPMYTEEFMPSFEQYWDAYKILFDNSEIISVTEPLVNTFLGLNGLNGPACGGRSMRVAPDRKLKACVYWPDSDLTIDDLLEKKEAVFETPQFHSTHYTPKFCADCVHVANCGGGCAARRRLRGNLDAPDEYCPIYRKKSVSLTGQFSSATKPLRTGSICTAIVRGTISVPGS